MQVHIRGPARAGPGTLSHCDAAPKVSARRARLSWAVGSSDRFFLFRHYHPGAALTFRCSSSSDGGEEKCRPPEEEGEQLRRAHSFSGMDEEGTVTTDDDRNSLLGTREAVTSRLLLLFVPLFWGTFGPAIRFIFQQPNPPAPSVLTFARKVVSLIFFFCFLPLESFSKKLPQDLSESVEPVRKYQDRDIASKYSSLMTGSVGAEWFAAVELGLWTFLGTACQTDGLEKTSATRAGFLVQSITVMVPILSAFSGVRVGGITWAAAVLALIGVTFFSTQLDDTVTSITNTTNVAWSDLHLSTGDLEILLAALFYALCTVRLSVVAGKFRAIHLSTNLMVVSTILAALWVLSDLDKVATHGEALEKVNTMDFGLLWQRPDVIAAVVFTALVPGTLASLCQTIGQRAVPAAEAQVYYSLQPFWSAVLASTILQETMNSGTWVAGILMTLATLMASYDSLLGNRK